MIIQFMPDLHGNYAVPHMAAGAEQIILRCGKSNQYYGIAAVLRCEKET